MTLEINGSTYDGIDIKLLNDRFEVVPELVTEVGKTLVGDAAIAHTESVLNYGQAKPTMNVVEADCDYYHIEFLSDKAGGSMGDLIDLVQSDGTITVLSDDHALIEGEYSILDYAKGERMIDGRYADDGSSAYLHRVKITLEAVDDEEDDDE